MAKHQKHTNISRRKSGNFAPNEISILGAKCSIISDLVHQVSKRVSNYNLAYFDASHAKDVEKNLLTDFTFHHDGNLSVTTSSSWTFVIYVLNCLLSYNFLIALDFTS